MVLVLTYQVLNPYDGFKRTLFTNTLLTNTLFTNTLFPIKLKILVTELIGDNQSARFYDPIGLEEKRLMPRPQEAAAPCYIGFSKAALNEYFQVDWV